MPRFSQQVLSALSNPQAGMLTGQAIANVGGRLAQIPANIRAEQQQKAQQAALQQGLLAYDTQDSGQFIEAARAMAAAGNPEAALTFASQGSELNKSAADKRRNAQLQRTLTAIQSAAEKGTPLSKLTKLTNTVVSLGGTQENVAEAYDAGKNATDQDTTFGSSITEWIDPNTGKVQERTVQTNTSATPVSLTTGQPVNVTGLVKNPNKPSTVVNLGGDEKYAEKGLEQLATTDVKTIELGAEAADNLYSIGEARQVLSETPEVLGAFGKEISATKKGLLKVLDVFGVSPTDLVYKKMTQQVSNADLINVFTQDFVRTRMDATKGAISDTEMKTFLASVPNLLQTPEGYKKVLDYMEKANTLAIIKADGLTAAFNTENVKENAFKFKDNFNSFTRVFSPNLNIPASAVDSLWRSFSENKMSPDNITFSFLDPSANQQIQATYGELKKEARKKNITMDALINTLFTNFNANVVY